MFICICYIITFKFDGLFTLQITGDGPLRILVIDIEEQKFVRGCARFEADQIQSLSTQDSKNIQKVFGQGTLVTDLLFLPPRSVLIAVEPGARVFAVTGWEWKRILRQYCSVAGAASNYIKIA